ncbi:MAG TPA: hypothetical protein VK698_17025 [Kofleriaceae bacterium]|nr:hypothetical protein [Kofleriaceae bacterium]
MVGRTAAVIALVLAIGAPATARAERLLAVVLVSADADAELAGRVEGQTSDLDVALVIERRPAGATGSPALGEATAAARRRGARVVVWFERDAASWLVHVAEPDEEREFVRRVAARGDLASSATAEGVALVVRGALRALAAGGTIGVAEPSPSVDEVRRGFAGLGWRAVSAGGPLLHHGVSARAGVRAGRWHGVLTTSYSPAVSIEQAGATIELERWSFAGGVGVELGTAPTSGETRWRLGFAVDGGATRFERVTTSASGTLNATPPGSIWSPTVSGRAQLARRLGGRVWLELAVGAEVLLRAPEFGVASGSTFSVHTRLRPIEPLGALGLVIDLG